MAANFIGCDRDQDLPCLREWLPEDHWRGLLSSLSQRWIWLRSRRPIASMARSAGARSGDHGRAVALLLRDGERSSRRIERRCVEDVAARVICVNRAPDHTTIARFASATRRRWRKLFGDVQALRVDAGLVRVGVVAVDGTKVHANTSQRAMRDYEQIAREILEAAAEIDAVDHGRFGERRGDDLPSGLSTRQGRQRWLRDARPPLDEGRAQEARRVPRSRTKRLVEAKRRLEEQLEVECRANADYEAYRARGMMKVGRRFGGPPKPYRPPDTPAGKINLTDLDSRNVKTAPRWVQGYNAQAATT